MFELAYEKMKLCMEDVNQYKDLIEINIKDNSPYNSYQLHKSLVGKNIKNRVENLIVSAWSSKDWLKKQIIRDYDKKTADEFEKALFQFNEVSLIQYLADSIKHCGIDDKYLKLNPYKDIYPKLGKTVLILMNVSVPGQLKPFFRLRGEVVPSFQIEDVVLNNNEEISYNFDTIILSMEILDNENRVIDDAMMLIDKYINTIVDVFKKYQKDF